LLCIKKRGVNIEEIYNEDLMNGDADDVEVTDPEEEENI
jgi:hypothetical protein